MTVFTSFVVFLSWSLAKTQGSPIQSLSFEAKERQTPPETMDKSSSNEVLARAFEPWLTGKHGIDNIRINISEFIESNTPIHPYELAHLYDGDIMGVGGHFVVEEDGRRHFHINIWPDGVVPYVIIGRYGDKDLKKIDSAFEQYHQHTCIRFVPRSKERLYLQIQSKEPGCWSYIGQLNRAQELNLQSPGCMSQSTIIHELMHAIGFIHEQSRPDRDKYVEIHLENLRNKKHAKNFDIKPDLYENVGIPYDVGSIMQYDETSFAKKNTKTMVAKNGRKLGNPVGFAKSDIREINRLYQCEGLQY